MESLLTAVLTSIFFAVILNRKHRSKLKKISFSQSALHMIIRDMLPSNHELKSKVATQAKLHMDKSTVKVIRTPDNKVYWVENNNFYFAEIIDGEFNTNSGQLINTENLSKKEVEELLFILDNLKNGY